MPTSVPGPTFRHRIFQFERVHPNIGCGIKTARAVTNRISNLLSPSGPEKDYAYASLSLSPRIEHPQIHQIAMSSLEEQGSVSIQDPNSKPVTLSQIKENKVFNWKKSILSSAIIGAAVGAAGTVIAGPFIGGLFLPMGASLMAGLGISFGLLTLCGTAISFGFQRLIKQNIKEPTQMNYAQQQPTQANIDQIEAYFSIKELPEHNNDETMQLFNDYAYESSKLNVATKNRDQLKLNLPRSIRNSLLVGSGLGAAITTALGPFIGGLFLPMSAPLTAGLALSFSSSLLLGSGIYLWRAYRKNKKNIFSATKEINNIQLNLQDLVNKTKRLYVENKEELAKTLYKYSILNVTTKALAKSIITLFNSLEQQELNFSMQKISFVQRDPKYVSSPPSSQKLESGEGIAPRRRAEDIAEQDILRNIELLSRPTDISLEGLKTAYTNLAELQKIARESNIPDIKTKATEGIKKVNKHIADISTELKLTISGSDTDGNSYTYYVKPAENNQGKTIPNGMLIGKGGMAEIYRAYDPVNNRDVAIKILLELSVENKFREEFSNQAKLDRPDIVRVFSFGKYNQQYPFISMELVDSPWMPLDKYLSIYKKLDPALVARIAIKCTEAMHAVSSQKLSHRDIKPSNIFILYNEKNNALEIKISDFGLVKDFSSAEQSRTDFVAGTPIYMAPYYYHYCFQTRREKSKNSSENQKLLIKSDIYSLGAMLFGLLTGKDLPWKNDYRDVHDYDLLTKLKEKLSVSSDDNLEIIALRKNYIPPQELGDIGVKIPDILWRIITTMVSLDPDQNYSSFLHVKHEFEYYLHGEQDKGAPWYDRHPSIAKELEAVDKEAATKRDKVPAPDPTVLNNSNDTPAVRVSVPSGAVPPISVEVISENTSNVFLEGAKEKIQEDLEGIFYGNIEINPVDKHRTIGKISAIAEQHPDLVDLADDIMAFLLAK